MGITRRGWKHYLITLTLILPLKIEEANIPFYFLLPQFSGQPNELSPIITECDLEFLDSRIAEGFAYKWRDNLNKWQRYLE